MSGMPLAFCKHGFNMCQECFKWVLGLHQVCFKLSQLPSPCEGLVPLVVGGVGFGVGTPIPFTPEGIVVGF